MPGLRELPTRISLFRDSQCTISTVGCDQKLPDVWFGNQVAEILDQILSGRNLGIMVNEFHHWPGDSNIADLPTWGKATYPNITEDSD